ncbi:MAG: EAL domain-containing protein [Mycobacteriales bacterium]
MGRTRWWRSIAAQVWGMVLACVVLVTGLIVVNTRAELAHERSQVSEALHRRGSTSAQTMIGTLRPGGVLEQALTNLAAQPSVAGGGRGCAATLDPLQQAASIGYIAVVDGSGRVRCSAGLKGVAASSQLFAAQPLVRAAVATGARTTDGPFRDPYSGALSMFAAAPVPGHPQTSLLYVFGTQRALAPEDKDRSVTSVVVDTRTMTVLMRYPELPDAVGSRLTGTSLARAAEDLHHITTATGLDDVRRLYRSVQLPGTPYRLVVGESEQKAYAAVRSSLRRSALIGIGLVLVVGLLGLLLQRRIARPARTLRAAIGALADDPEAAPAPTTGPVELAAVAHAFNTTAAARRRADGLSRAILEHASDHLLVMDGTGTLSFVAPIAQRTMGVTAGTKAMDLCELLHPEDREHVLRVTRTWLEDSTDDLQLEARIFDVHGVLHHLDVQGQDLRVDHNVGGVVLTCRDVTERKRFEQHLAHQAKHDPLTDLPNRAAVFERLHEELSEPGGLPVGVLFVDLDRFKLVNDSHGHAIGDKVLVALSRKLTEVVRPGDLVGRFGGDEFVLVAPAIGTEAAAHELARRVRTALDAPLLVGQRELFVSGSVGIALGLTGDAPETVLRNADTAMYRAKALGRNCVALFDAEMRAEAQRLLRTESDLHRALERDQLALVFQPVLSLGDDSVLGAEALVRWHHPERGLVPPSDFIPVAEETGLVVPIGEWVLREACAWAALTAERVKRPVRVSVNVSPRQLTQPRFVGLVDEVLLSSGLAAHLLCLEVTETVLVQDADTAACTLTALHDRGVRVSIDDFGTGWSSLTYLQQFPVDEIKLDRSYVSRVDVDATAATIVGSLVGMAHSMGLSVTAEGVETAEQAAFLRSIRCDSAQGYLFARPLPGPEVEAFVRSARLAVTTGAGAPL